MKQQIGILALQGSFIEHAHAVESIGAEPVLIRLPEQLDNIEGLIIPGGESTTIGKLLEEYNLLKKIKGLALEGIPVYGTCAGMILLARNVESGNEAPTGVDSPNVSSFGVYNLGLIDITVRRNAFGRQLESFEEDLDIPVLGEIPFHSVFIRAPLILRTGEKVRILAALKDKRIVAAEQGNILVTAFHPELTDDLRVHKYFLNKVLSIKASLLVNK
ncbi:MAG: pyridoxal 5'-phosphate synthase glutaminase subunit PdxT [Spirochaetales bacterium]|nr:pyridoxal 5'-phosphate synthase glutaminase subunit PdxT [Spirochaetales bacterium]